MQPHETAGERRDGHAPAGAPSPTLSVITPMYDEADVLPLFVERLRPVLDALPDIDGSYEVVAVDDGSRDDTPVILQRIRRTWPQLRVMRLRANAGHQAAISAGLVAARGSWVVTIDADLQDPPEVIAEMLHAARTVRVTGPDDDPVEDVPTSDNTGADYEPDATELTALSGQPVDVVYGVRTDRRSDGWFKRASAAAFYGVMRRAGASSIRTGAGDYRMMSRATVDAVNALPESHRVLRLVVPSLEFPSTWVGYRRDTRPAGKSKYPLGKMIKLSVDSLTGFSIAPLRMATWFGLGGFLIAAGLLCYALIANVTGATIAGWTSTVVIVAGVGALQLLCLGVLGEYVGRIYSTLQRRPTYYVAYDSANPTGASPHEGQSGQEHLIAPHDVATDRAFRG